MRVQHKWLAAGTSLALATFLWPGPEAASADTSLGGYQGSAIASVVHIDVFDPTIPIPATPQLEASLAYSNSGVQTGPTTRALASYLWPGAVIGDGFDQLTKVAGTSYPVQVDSRYPATTTAPANNTIQLTDGNGMTTSSDGFNTNATVTLLGLAGPATNVGGGLGTGLGKLGAKSPSSAPKTIALKPLPVSPVLAALVTAQNITSTATTTVASRTVTSLAHASASQIGLLGGIIKIAGFDATSQVVSDGTKATVSGDATIGSVSILGLKLPIDANGVNLGLPLLSKTVSGLLSTLGISIATVPTTNTVTGATGEFHSKVLVLSIDTKPLKSIVNNILSPIFAMLPTDARSQLQPVLDLGPKIVITLGSADATTSASPAFAGGFTGGGGPTGGFTAGTPGTPGTPGTSGFSPGTAGGILPGTNSGAPGVSQVPMTTQASFALPPLGAIPKALIFGALVLAALIGWFFRRAAGAVLGGTRNCDYGLVTGVPDLRRG